MNEPHTDEELVVSHEAMDTPQGVYETVRFVCGFCECHQSVIAGLTWSLCDYLREAPCEIRGQAAARVVEIISNSVRQSLQ